MVEQTQYLTPEGLDTLEKRYQHFVTVRRSEVAERLRLALDEGGELTENAEYDDAKNEQAFVEGEIARLEGILRNAQIITEQRRTDIVTVGATVTVTEKGGDGEERYQLVGSAEANPREGKISVESPLGKALLGAKKGDKVKVKAPDGQLVFTIRTIA